MRNFALVLIAVIGVIGIVIINFAPLPIITPYVMEWDGEDGNKRNFNVLYPPKFLKAEGSFVFITSGFTANSGNPNYNIDDFMFLLMGEAEQKCRLEVHLAFIPNDEIRYYFNSMKQYIRMSLRDDYKGYPLQTLSCGN